MKYAVISDIHANLEALTACMKEIKKLNPDKIICLGDLVDYGAQPNECIKIIKEKADIILLGNHDEALIDPAIVKGFNSYARESSIKTRKIIKKDYLEWFKTLPRFAKLNDVYFVHSSPCLPSSYNYIRYCEDALLNFSYFTEKVCFIGHSHKADIFELNGENVFEVETEQLDRKKRYIINTGSVGQPRDRDPRASFGLFDDETFIYKNIRLEYDINSAARKIYDAKLPEILGRRLFEGY